MTFSSMLIILFVDSYSSCLCVLRILGSCPIHCIPVGAVIGRERNAAVYQKERGSRFAANDRSYGF